MTNKKNFPESLIDSINECKTAEELWVLIKTKLVSRTIIEKEDLLKIEIASIKKLTELIPDCCKNCCKKHQTY